MGNLHQQLDALQRQLAAIQRRLDDVSSVDSVFVVGCPRSGTSVLSWALAEHPSFWTSSESNFLYEFAAPRGGVVSFLREAFEKGNARADGWLRTNGVGYEEFAANVGFGFHSLFASHSRGKRWVDSSTENLLVAQELSLMFPKARFLHVVRDGRSVVASMLESGFVEPWATDFTTACETWVRFVGAGLEFQEARSGRMLEVRNETMADDCDRIVEFLDEFPHPKVAEFLRERRVNSSYGNVTPADLKRNKPPEVRPRREPWRGWSEERAALFDELAGPMQRRLGYGAARPA